MDKTGLLIERIKKEYPDPQCELKFGSPFQLLVAVVLSAQCTDKRVNQVTEKMFKKYSTPKDFVDIDINVLENEIKSCGFYHNKAKAIKSLSEDIVNKFGGKVPSKKEDLKTLSGVGEKTANVVISMAFGTPAIAVDTHVFRVSNRLGLANSNTPEKTQAQLENKLPKEFWTRAHYSLVLHGRYVCKAIKPRCEICNLKEFCEFYKNNTKISHKNV